MALAGYGPSPYVFTSLEGLEAAIEAALKEFEMRTIKINATSPLLTPKDLREASIIEVSGGYLDDAQKEKIHEANANYNVKLIAADEDARKMLSVIFTGA